MVISIGLAQGCYSETHGCHKVVTSELQPCLKLVVVGPQGCPWKVVYNVTRLSQGCKSVTRLLQGCKHI